MSYQRVETVITSNSAGWLQLRQILFSLCSGAAKTGRSAIVASAIGHLAADFLINTSPTDARTYLGVSLGLALAAMVACYIPARRATRVDPVVTLRNE